VRDLTDAGAAARFALRVLGVDAPPLHAETIEPDPARHQRFRELMTTYARLYPALAEAMHELAAFAREEARP
jgi:sugar (pentulose or hexulose) kinase